MFIPFEVIITPQRARDSEIREILEKYPKFFKSHERSADFILWVYLVFEKTKGPNSFFHPYFNAVGNPEMLMDWTMPEKVELQDRFLLFEAKKQEKIALMYFNSILHVFEENSQWFHSGNLFEDFLWAYRLVTTRAFSHGEGMVIPFADNLNHEDVYVDYLTLSTGFLEKKKKEPVLEKDYKDYSGFSHESPAIMHGRTHFNRLEKRIREGLLELRHVNNVWDLEVQLKDYESSSDEEELITDLNEPSEEENENSEEESEEDEDEEEKVEETMENKYFIMRTGSEGGFLQGNQVFNCYGRLNNTDMLLEYGFCLLPNRYDSVYVRVIHNQMLKTVNNSGKIEIPKLDLQETTRLKDYLKVYYLKYFKINEKFLEYSRKVILTQHERFTPAGELKVLTQSKKIILELQNCFRTSLEQDEETLLTAPAIPIRLYFALSKFLFRVPNFAKINYFEPFEYVKSIEKNREKNIGRAKY